MTELLPSILLSAFFEGTVMSAGRGTKTPFQLYCTAKYKKKYFYVIPRSRAGAKYPKFKGKRCYGVDLSKKSIYSLRKESRLNLTYLQDAYNHYPDKKHFFSHRKFFDKLAGNNKLRKQIEAGMAEKEIRESWQKGLLKFKQIRKKYLLYP